MSEYNKGRNSKYSYYNQYDNYDYKNNSYANKNTNNYTETSNSSRVNSSNNNQFLNSQESNKNTTDSQKEVKQNPALSYYKRQYGNNIPNNNLNLNRNYNSTSELNMKKKKINKKTVNDKQLYNNNQYQSTNYERKIEKTNIYNKEIIEKERVENTFSPLKTSNSLTSPKKKSRSKENKKNEERKKENNYEKSYDDLNNYDDLSIRSDHISIYSENLYKKKMSPNKLNISINNNINCIDLNNTPLSRISSYKNVFSIDYNKDENKENDTKSIISITNKLSKCEEQEHERKKIKYQKEIDDLLNNEYIYNDYDDLENNQLDVQIIYNNIEKLILTPNIVYDWNEGSVLVIKK